MKLEALFDDAKFVPTHEQEENARKLLEAVNHLEDYLGLTFIVTSGVRSIKRHLEIYKRLQEQDRLEKKPIRPIPMKSVHLRGGAVDFLCKELAMIDFQALLCPNTKGVLREDLEEIAEKKGLYFESFSYTPTWVHMQIFPPASKKRFFVPY